MDPRDFKSYKQRTSGIVKKCNEVKTRFPDTKIFAMFYSSSEETMLYISENWLPEMQKYVSAADAKEAGLPKGDRRRFIYRPDNFVSVSDARRGQASLFEIDPETLPENMIQDAAAYQEPSRPAQLEDTNHPNAHVNWLQGIANTVLLDGPDNAPKSVIDVQSTYIAEEGERPTVPSMHAQTEKKRLPEKKKKAMTRSSAKRYKVYNL